MRDAIMQENTPNIIPIRRHGGGFADDSVVRIEVLGGGGMSSALQVRGQVAQNQVGQI